MGASNSTLSAPAVTKTFKKLTELPNDITNQVFITLSIKDKNALAQTSKCAH